MQYSSARIGVACLLVCVMAQRSPGRGAPERSAPLFLPAVTCSARGVRAVFGPLVKPNLRVRDASGAAVPVDAAKASCGVRLSTDRNDRVAFFSRYDGCYGRVEGGAVVIPLLVQLAGEDRWIKVNVSCPLRTRTSQITPTFAGDCDADKSLRIDCGLRSVSGEACSKLGCCYDAPSASCFYKLNSCSLDGHFVFTVKASDTRPPLDPRSLMIRDQPRCLPVVTTPDTAVFKLSVTDCGAKTKLEGDLVVYEVEVEEAKRTGRRSPISLQVQCEYDASDLDRAKALRSLYSMTNPPAVVAEGSIKVQMRIATDDRFTSFFPEDQLPLTLPLREAVNVEISIMQPSPDPDLSLRVRDCFAYPASKHSVWTLLHEGCPNPLDSMSSSVPVDGTGRTGAHSQVRRFDVKTFAFLDPDTGGPSSEKMFFYCWVEICSQEVDCAQSCTIISSEGGRRRRSAPPAAQQVQLLSFGPLALVQ